jgi:hypothetical protein
MNEPTFNGISKSDMKYVDYLAHHRFRDFTSFSLETDLSAEHRIKKLINQGYIVFNNGELCFSFDTVIALTDYRNYLEEQKIISKEKFIRHWVPVLINFILSSIAIIISIIALLKP